MQRRMKILMTVKSQKRRNRLISFQKKKNKL